jgi:hypothetical protein
MVIMKHAIFFVLAFLITSCGSVNDLAGYQPFIVNHYGGNEYQIIFNGTKYTTSDEAREAWAHRAKGTCQGEYQYLTYKEYKNLSEGKPIESLSKCPNGIDLSCIQTEKDFGDTLIKRHIVVRGMAICLGE